MSVNGTFRSYNIVDLTFVDIQEYLKTKDLILVPVASTEQHGPHLPRKPIP
jgi:creatinine amidohydrolase